MSVIIEPSTRELEVTVRATALHLVNEYH